MWPEGHLVLQKVSGLASLSVTVFTFIARKSVLEMMTGKERTAVRKRRRKLGKEKREKVGKMETNPNR